MTMLQEKFGDPVFKMSILREFLCSTVVLEYSADLVPVPDRIFRMSLMSRLKCTGCSARLRSLSKRRQHVSSSMGCIEFVDSEVIDKVGAFNQAVVDLRCYQKKYRSRKRVEYGMQYSD